MTFTGQTVKGVVHGILVTIAVLLCYNVISGNWSYLFSPLDGGVGTRSKNSSGLKVILLGTGTPIRIHGRSRPAVAILAGSKTFLFDCGGGVAGRLVDAGISPSRVSAVFITHHHSDHTSGFTDLFVSGLSGGRETVRNVPLGVYGPVGTRRIIGLFMKAMRWDLDIRMKHLRDRPEAYYADIHESNDGIVYDEEGLQVTAFPVDHGIVKPALGYRIKYRNRVVVISGDTLPCKNMIRYSKNADILFHEAYSSNWINRGVKRYPEMEPLAERIMTYHSSTFEVAEIARKASVKHLVFTHLMPSPSPVWYFELSWSEGVSEIYQGKITVGRDLMEFRVR